ncbi:MAG TPA: ester cyclase [Planctomycetaceae bacterium]
MSERNAELARRFFQEVWNERRAETIDELVHPGGVAHHTNGELTSAEQFRDIVHKRFLDAFPDLHIEIEDVLAAGDQAVVRWSANGTHLGDGLGVKASRQKVAFRGMTWFVFRDGKIVEGWDCWDHGGLLQALWRAAPPGDGGAPP